MPGKDSSMAQGHPTSGRIVFSIYESRKAMEGFTLIRPYANPNGERTHDFDD